MNDFYLRVDKNSKGAEGRLYRAVRLITLYNYRAENCGWTKKFRERYKKATYGMWQLFWCIVHNRYPGYNKVEFETLGSRKVIDLEMNRSIRFLIILKRE